MKIRLASPITRDSIVDGPGLRAVIWAQGCFHHCPGCHNPCTHNPFGGFEMDTADVIEQIVICLIASGHVLLEDVTMTNQPSGWSYWIHDCDRVTIRGLQILAELAYPNNDGIHLNCSRDVTVSDCHIECGDDAIVIRANSRSLKENKPIERVTVTNCVLRSSCYGIRVGYSDDGVMRHCTFSNLVITESRDGIGFTLPNSLYPRKFDFGREDSLIEDMLFSNIVMDGIYGKPIVCIFGDKSRIKAVRDIHFSNVHATGKHFPSLVGRESAPLQNFTFDNCSFVREAAPDQIEPELFQYTEGFKFNGTSFTARVVKPE